MTSYVRHALSLLATLAMVCGLTLVGAAPAQAVITVDLTASETTISLGDEFDLSWTSTDAITPLVASGDWSGDKDTPAGSEPVTPPSIGTFTYTLLATDENGREATDTVTVEVVNAPITPAPVTFDGCEVIVPSTPNVTYFVDYGDEDIEELEADTYPADYFDVGGPVLFYAEAADGFSFADEAVTEWEYTSPEECFGGADLVTTTATCDSVTFTNITDSVVTVFFGSFGEEQEDGEFELEAGGTHTVETDRDPLDFIAYAGEEGEDGVQIDSKDKPNNCGGVDDDSDHPTVAPAAGK
ncbi:hypothetical protein [Aeromicrobium sp.]|uniref:hypothetical protein n=1 Tax=Aeromicrobium sp. TaxID=1871063 RepID=UPI002FC93005